MDTHTPLALAGLLALGFAADSSAQSRYKTDASAALSAEAFFKPNSIQDIDLAPSGRWMSIRELNGEGSVQLKVIDLDGK